MEHKNDNVFNVDASLEECELNFVKLGRKRLIRILLGSNVKPESHMSGS